MICFCVPSLPCAPPGEPSPGQGGDHQHGGGDVPGSAAAAIASGGAGEEEQQHWQCQVSRRLSLLPLPPHHTRASSNNSSPWPSLSIHSQDRNV